MRERGIVHILILVAAVGLIGFILISSSAEFKDKLFGTLFPKQKSQAAVSPIVFKDTNGNTLSTNTSGIPQSTSATVKIELTSTLGPPASPNPSPTAARVFVTSTTYTGNLGGLSGADAKCQTSAANLGGTWKAWLSDSTYAASSRLINSSVPYKTVDGTGNGGNAPETIANNWTDLTDGTGSEIKVNTDEFGKLSSNSYRWTNTTYAGGKTGTDPNSHCNNWISSDIFQDGQVGVMNPNPGYSWTDGAGSGCDVPSALYCFEQIGIGTSPTSTPASSPSTSCNAQTKPTTVTMESSDGTWCYDSDGNGSYNTAGYCIDSCNPSKNDYCEVSTVRDGYCSGTWNGSFWANVHCEYGGYDCSSFNSSCSNGACVSNATSSYSTPAYLTPATSPAPTTSSYPTPAYLTPSVLGVTEGAVSYRIAESATALDNAIYQPYNQEPTLIDYTFQNTEPGIKTFWVEFKDNIGIGTSIGTTDRQSAQIELLPPCEVAINMRFDTSDSTNVTSVPLSTSVTPRATFTVSAPVYCVGKPITFRKVTSNDLCAGTEVGSCLVNSESAGCSGSAFTPTSTETYSACIDKNGDNDTADPGESGQKDLIVTSRVFVTSTKYDGNLGGLSGADAKCQAAADDPNKDGNTSDRLGGTWKAWLSDSQTSAESRLHHFNGQFVRVGDGVVIADDWSELTLGFGLQKPIVKTETGASLLATSPWAVSAVWTNTREDGTIYIYSGSSYTTTSCDNWTTNTSDLAKKGWVGITSSTADDVSTTASWTRQGSSSCSSTTRRLYCFEQPPSTTATAQTRVSALSAPSPGTIAISNISNGAFLRGTKSVNTTVSDPQGLGITKVELLVDGNLAGSKTKPLYNISWNTTTVADGLHILTAKVYYGNGTSQTSSPVNVTVDNKLPTVSITSPLPNANVSGTVAIVASVSDALGIKNVKFLIDGASKKTLSQPLYNWNWNSTTVANGIHNLKVTVTDNAGNSSSTVDVPVNVQN